MLDAALLIGRAVYACARGHEQHETGPCRTTLKRFAKTWQCLRPTHLARHEPSALALAIGIRDGLRREAEVAGDADRERLEAALDKARRRVIEAAVEAGIEWDEAQTL